MVLTPLGRVLLVFAAVLPLLALTSAHCQAMPRTLLPLSYFATGGEHWRSLEVLTGKLPAAWPHSRPCARPINRCRQRSSFVPPYEVRGPGRDEGIFTQRHLLLLAIETIAPSPALRPSWVHQKKPALAVVNLKGFLAAFAPRIVVSGSASFRPSIGSLFRTPLLRNRTPRSHLAPAVCPAPNRTCSDGWFLQALAATYIQAHHYQ